MSARMLSRFTPSLLDPQSLEALFVGREALAARLVDKLRASALGPSKHHMLLVGPRGIGKTHLVALVYHRLQADAELRDHLVVAWLREEEWSIASFLDLLLSVLNSLSGPGIAADLPDRLDELRAHPPAEALRRAETLLAETIGQRTLLVLAENLDAIFEGLGETGQQELRAYVQNHPFVSILATTPSLFPDVSLRTSPFYGFFEVHHLKPFDLDDAVTLLYKIAKRKGDAKLAAMLQTPLGRARIRAVHHLAGGNPRVYVIFSNLLTAETLDSLVEPVMQTLDDLTPYYQARMSTLSAQQRKIVDVLCERRGAVTVNEIAQRAFITAQTASAQLKRLRELNVVRSERAGRESYYELSEPLMRMTLEVKRHRGDPIRLFVEVLRLWLTPREISDKLDALPQSDALMRRCLQEALQVARSKDEVDPRVAACSRDLERARRREDLESMIDISREIVELTDSEKNREYLGNLLVAGGRVDEARGFLDEPEIFESPGSASCSKVGILVGLEQWTRLPDAFAEALRLIFQGAEPGAGTALLRALVGFVTAVPGEQQRDYAQACIRVAKAHNDLLSLSIAVLLATIDRKPYDSAWPGMWVELSRGARTLSLVASFLEPTLKYLESGDHRFLLGLAAEERDLIEKLCELDKPRSTEPPEA